MNELLEKKGAELIEFIETQAPLLCADIITYGRWSSAVTMAFSVTFAIVGIIAVVCGGRKALRDFEKDDVPWAFFVAMVGLLGVIFGTMVTALESKYFMLAWFAPRLYVLEYIKDFVN